ncbi:hypothetical protein VOLCADRAFT_89175 [Volvox carteri f. nagariensis]|uniref:Uncharacterized protein n=1 Tax=Volvox carteri f. nagariensis TaxID=3068 RepID=D8TR01_VOLCA|nr:uncharacterized protein VOLCADRAFT_89175 [Volvox carteri f. nagariensis]EFJ50114.1 hypothetical protein VOLCADRAFT_89175 [Volvox carteri f. nagariensis]|eukprot:XP_002948734.1 hypothetical protein VOLCADRAFT_89175 [Volvox carteri f. nagariensis]
MIILPANIRVSGSHGADATTSRTQIQALNVVATAYRAGRSSFPAASPCPSRDQDHNSTSGVDLNDLYAHPATPPARDPMAVASAERYPHHSDSHSRLSARLVLLAADNAACLTSSQLYDIVYAIRRAADEPDCGLQLPPVAVERLIRELRRRRQLAALLDLPDSVFRLPYKGPLSHKPPEASRPVCAAATAAASTVANDAVAATAEEAGDSTGSESATQSELRQVHDTDLAAPSEGSVPLARSAASSCTGNTGAASAAGDSGRRPRAAASADPTAAAATDISTSPASASRTARRTILGRPAEPEADLADVVTRQPAGPRTAAFAVGLHAGQQGQAQPQRPPSLGAVEAPASKKLRTSARQAAITPLPSPAAEEQHVHTAPGSLLRPQTSKRRVRQPGQLKLRQLGDAVVAAGSPSAAVALPLVQAGQQDTCPPRSPGDVDGGARTHLQRRPIQDVQQQQQEGDDADRDADLQRFFEELHNVGAGLPAQEALAALETCAVAGALPPRATYEALLRSVRRAAAAAAAMAKSVRAATAVSLPPKDPDRTGAARSGELAGVRYPGPSGGTGSISTCASVGVLHVTHSLPSAPARTRPPLLSPTRIVAVLHGLTRLGQRLSQPLWRDLLSYLLSYPDPLPQRREKGGNSAAAAAAAAAWRPHVATLNSYDLVDLATAMATAGCNPSTQFLEAHAAAVMRWARQLTGRQAARLLWSYASLNFRPPAAVQAALAATLLAETDVEPGELAQGVSALALLAAAAASSGGSLGTAATAVARRSRAVWAAGAPSIGVSRNHGLMSLVLDAAMACKQRHDALYKAALEPGTACDGSRAAAAGQPYPPGGPWSLMSFGNDPLISSGSSADGSDGSGGSSRARVVEVVPGAVAAKGCSRRDWAAVRGQGGGGGALDGAGAAAVAVAQLPLLEEQHGFMSWLMEVLCPQGQAAAAHGGAHGGSTVRGVAMMVSATTAGDSKTVGGVVRLLPPLPGPLSAAGLAVTCRLVLLLLHCNSGTAIADEAWAQHLLRQTTSLAPSLRPADLVPVMQLVCHLYGMFPALLADGDAAEDATVPWQPGPRGSAALQTLVVSACSSMECLSYGQVVAMYGSVSALAAEPQILGRLGDGRMVVGPSAKPSAASPMSPDAVLLARAAARGRSVTATAGISTSGSSSGPVVAVSNPSCSSTSRTACTAVVACCDDGLEDPARWLLSLLRDPEGDHHRTAGGELDAAVPPPRAAVRNADVGSSTRVAGEPTAGSCGAAIGSSNAAAIATAAVAAALPTSKPASDSKSAVIQPQEVAAVAAAKDRESTTPAAEADASAVETAAAAAAAAAPRNAMPTVSDFTAGAEPAAASSGRVTAAASPASISNSGPSAGSAAPAPRAGGLTFPWPIPSHRSQRMPELLAPPRRRLQGAADAVAVHKAVAASAGAAPAQSGPLEAAHANSQSPASTAAFSDRAAVAAAAASANGALQALIGVLRSCAEAREPLPAWALLAMQTAWRQHLQLQPQAQLRPPEVDGCAPPPPPSTADARVVAELLLAVAAAVPWRAAARSAALLELAAVLGAGGQGALRKLSPVQLTSCVHAVALAASGRDGDASSACDDGGADAAAGARRVGRAAAAKRAAALIAAMEPLLDEVHRRIATYSDTTAAEALPPPCVAVVCRALSYLSYTSVWPSRLRRREAAVAAAARARLAAAPPGSPSSPSSVCLRRAIASHMPPLSAQAPPPPSAIQYGIWVLRHLDLQVGPTWLERLAAGSPRYLRRMHPRATVDWLAACAARSHVPPRPALRMAWLHLQHTWRFLGWQELYEVVWNAVQLRLRPPRYLLAAACESVADAAAATAAAVSSSAVGGSSALHGSVPDEVSTSAVAADAAAAETGSKTAGNVGIRGRGAADTRCGSSSRHGGRSARHTASVAARLLWAVQFDERYTPTRRATAALCAVLVQAWGSLTAGEQSAALWALARLPPLSGSERAVHESGLGGVVVRHFVRYSTGALERAVTRDCPGKMKAEAVQATGNTIAALGPADDVRGCGSGDDAASAADLARTVYALARLRQSLPQPLAAQLCGRLVAMTAMPRTVGPAAEGTLEAVPAAAAYGLADGLTEASFGGGLRPKEVVQALYGASRLLLGHSPGATGDASTAAVVRPLLRAALSTDPSVLDARSLADALGTLSRFRRALARHRPRPRLQTLYQSPQQDPTSKSNQGLDPDLGPDWNPRPEDAGTAAVSGSAGAWSNDPWVISALACAGELFVRSALRGLGDRPVPAWCVLEILQAAGFLGAPVGPQLAAAAARLLSLHLPSMPPARLADVLTCCAAQPSPLPADLAWEALQQLVRVETRLATAAADGSGEIESGNGRGGGAAAPWPPLQPDELARAVLAAAQAVDSLVAWRRVGHPRPEGGLVGRRVTHDDSRGCSPGAESAPGLAASWTEVREVWLPPPLQLSRLLAAAVAELACRPADPRVAAMSPDQLSMLVQGVVAAGAAPGAAWLEWVCELMRVRLEEASQHGLLRMCGALEVAEMWPGQAWAQACLEQASKLVKALRMPKTSERQIQAKLLRLRALGAAAAAASHHIPDATPPPFAAAVGAANGGPAADVPVLGPGLSRSYRTAGPKTGERAARPAAVVTPSPSPHYENSGDTFSGGGAQEGQSVSAPWLPELIDTEARRALQLVYGMHGAFTAATRAALRIGGADEEGHAAIGGLEGAAEHAIWVPDEELRQNQALQQLRLADAPWDMAPHVDIVPPSAADRRHAAHFRAVEGNLDADVGACARADGLKSLASSGTEGQQQQQRQRQAPDAFSRLLLVYRLTETRVDRVMGLTRKVAALQSANALHALRTNKPLSLPPQQQQQQQHLLLQSELGLGSLAVPGQARRMDGMVGTESGWRDDGGDVVDEKLALVRAQATESTALTCWNMGNVGKGGLGNGMSRLLVPSRSGAPVRVSAEMLSPLAAYLQQQQQQQQYQTQRGTMPLGLGCFSEGEPRHGRARVHAGARGEEQGHQRHSGDGGVGEWRRGDASPDWSGLLACLVHVKYCGLLHTFNKM